MSLVLIPSTTMLLGLLLMILLLLLLLLQRSDAMGSVASGAVLWPALYMCERV